VHAGWVLEGRAVQDVWIMPRRSDRTARLDKKMNMFMENVLTQAFRSS
jgi:hypothetical protein